VSGHSGSRGRVRAFLGGRSTTQRIGVVAVLAVLATAPFGGLSKTDAGVAKIAIGTRYDIGPFYLTIDKVETLPDLKPFVRVGKGHQLLVIALTVVNHTDRTEDMSLVTEVLGGDHTAGTPWPNETTVRARLYDVADGSPVDFENVNPGATYQVAAVILQDAGADTSRLTLSLLGCDYQQEDILSTLSPNSWVPRFTIADGPLPVEVKT
jgi:hypothetical protein